MNLPYQEMSEENLNLNVENHGYRHSLRVQIIGTYLSVSSCPSSFGQVWYYLFACIYLIRQIPAQDKAFEWQHDQQNLKTESEDGI